GKGVEALIRERWATMRADSPNRTIADPAVRLYASANGDPRDVPQILRLLLIGARADAVPEPQLLALQPMKPRWAITRLLARFFLFMGTIWERPSVWVDNVVARPRLSCFVAAALALFAIIPLVFDVRKAIAALPDAATIATARQ